MSEYESQSMEINVNGVALKYVSVGNGAPIILVHGNGGSHHDLDNEITQLADAGYHVYAPDSRGQGANVPLDEYHYTDMAEDLYQFILALGLHKPALYGWSDGGINGLLLEIQHPGTLSLLAVSGANLRPDGLADNVLTYLNGLNADNPQPLITLMLKEPNIASEQLAGIRIPVCVTAGADDLIKPEHTKELAAGLPNSELIILEGEDHGSYIMNSDIMGGLLLDFLREHDYLPDVNAEKVNKADIQSLLRRVYGLDALRICRLDVGAGSVTMDVTTADARYILKRPSISEINSPEREPTLCDYLRTKGIPVSEFVQTLSGDMFCQENKQIWHLQKYVEGCCFPVHEAPEWLMPIMADMLGRIHTALSDYPVLPDGIGEGFFKHMTLESVQNAYARSLRWAEVNRDERSAAEIRERISIVSRMPRWDIDLSRMTRVNTHGDYFISQLICGEQCVNAVIDWTSACRHPAAWEIIRSFVYADQSCVNGEIDADKLAEYIRVYLGQAPLTTYDIEIMPYLYFYQLAVCDYYGQYAASMAGNRGIYLEQARFGTAVMRYMDHNLEKLSKSLITALQ